MKVVSGIEKKINFEKTLESMSVGETWVMKKPFLTVHSFRTKVSNYGKITGTSFTVNAPSVLNGTVQITRNK